MAGFKKAGLCYTNSLSFLLEGLAQLLEELNGLSLSVPFFHHLCECSSEGQAVHLRKTETCTCMDLSCSV